MGARPPSRFDRKTLAEDWSVRGERSNRWALKVLVWIALRLGRSAGLACIQLAAVYFMLTAPGARRASRRYLTRVLARRVRWRDCRRHFYTYGAVSLDKIYLYGDQARRLDVATHGMEHFRRYVRRGQGVLVFVAHLGSFEVLRTLSGETDKLRLQVLMDRATGAKANAALSAINPAAALNIIDTSASDSDRVLRVKTALDRGDMVGLMADRHSTGERTVDCDFLGGRAPFPAAPWLLASLTRAPVILAFGVYVGGNRYELHCEHFAERLNVPRARRTAAVGEVAQAYADRLAAYVRSAPFNWFNFYEFWHTGDHSARSKD